MLYNMLKQEAFIHDDGWSSTPSNHHAYNPSQILVHIRVCLKISTQFNSKKMVFFFFFAHARLCRHYPKSYLRDIRAEAVPKLRIQLTHNSHLHRVIGRTARPMALGSFLSDFSFSSMRSRKVHKNCCNVSAGPLYVERER